MIAHPNTELLLKHALIIEALVHSGVNLLLSLCEKNLLLHMYNLGCYLGEKIEKQRRDEESNVHELRMVRDHRGDMVPEHQLTIDAYKVLLKIFNHIFQLRDYHFKYDLELVSISPLKYFHHLDFKVFSYNLNYSCEI
jgi:hypothetical protein